ncbi:MAG: DUF2341 domain-containing protein [Candidatus Nanohaloarchaea archaeon]
MRNSEKKLSTIFLLTISFTALFTAPVAADGWWNSDWNYRKPINVTETQRTTLENHPVNISVNTATLLQQGKIQADCGDIRFGNETSVFNYSQRTPCNSQSTVFTFQLPKLGSLEQKTVYMYYNNSNAEKNQKGFFSFVDRFNSDTSSSYSWSNDQYTYQTRDGYVTIDATDSRTTEPKLSVTRRLGLPEKGFTEINISQNSVSTGNKTVIKLGSSQSFYKFKWVNRDPMELPGNGRFNISKVRNGEVKNSWTGEATLDNQYSFNIRAEWSPKSLELHINDNKIKNLSLSNPESFRPENFTFKNAHKKLNWSYIKICSRKQICGKDKTIQPDTSIGKEEFPWKLWLDNSTENLTIQESGNVSVTLNTSYNLRKEMELYVDGERRGSGTTSGLTAFPEFQENAYHSIKAVFPGTGIKIQRYVIVKPDNKAPNITLKKPKVLNDQKSVKFPFKAEDNFLTDLRCSLHVNGAKQKEQNVSANSKDFFKYPASEGANQNYRIKCKDAAGNTKNVSNSFTADYTSPNVTIKAPEADSKVYTTEPDVEWTASDKISDTVSYSLFLNNSLKDTGSISSGSSQTTDLGILEPTPYKLRIEVEDEYGNQKTLKRSFTVRESYVKLYKPENRSNVTEMPLSFKYRFFNDRYSQADCSLIIEGEEKVSKTINPNTNQSLSSNSLKQGLNREWTVKCSTPDKKRLSSRIANIDYEKPGFNLSAERNSPITYRNEEHEFKIEADDNIRLENIIFENNFSGSLENTSFRAKNQISPEYNLSAGHYIYRVYLEDYVGNEKLSSLETYRIRKGDPGLNLKARALTIVRDSSPEIKCSDANNQTSIKLYRNNTLLGEAANSITDNKKLSAGNYSYRCYTAGNENYTAQNLTARVKVVKYKEDPVKILINGERENKTLQYGENLSVNASSGSGTEKLYLNGTRVRDPFNKTLKPGHYVFKANSTGSYRYNASSERKTLKVEKAKPQINLNSSKGFKILKNQSTRILCSSPSNQASTSLYRNGTLLKSSKEEITLNESLDTGKYLYRCKVSATENYTTASINKTLRVSRKLEPGLVITADPGFYLNPGKTVNISCHAEHSQAEPQLSLEGKKISNPYIESHELGVYNYSCSVNSTKDYLSKTITETLIVKKNSSVQLMLNQKQHNVTIGQNRELNITARLLEPSGTIKIYENSSKLWQGENTTTYIKKYSKTGNLIIKASFAGNADYFPENQSYTVNVTDIDPPEINKTSPVYNWSRDNQQTFKFSVSDYHRFSCSFYINKDLKNVRNSIKSQNISFKTSLPTGNHKWRLSCTDSVGNTEKQSGEIYIDQSAPEARILNSSATIGNPSPSIKISVNDSVDEELNYSILVNGKTEAQGTVKNSSSKHIKLTQLPLGENKVTLKAEDSASHTSLSRTVNLKIAGETVYLLSPRYSEDVNTSKPEFKYKYYSDYAPLNCSLFINGTRKSKTERVPQGEEKSFKIQNLSTGTYNWRIKCSDRTHTVSNSRKTFVDLEKPNLSSQTVGRDSGHRYTSKPTTFKVEAEDNRKIEKAYLEASWLSKHQMKCQKELNKTECTYSTVVPAGRHTYSYILKDPAGNTVETQKNTYYVEESKANFVLKLNGRQENIKVEPRTQIEIEGEFIAPEFGSIYFKVNGTRIGMCGEGYGCSFYKNFKKEGKYSVKADFYSSRSYMHVEKQYLVTVEKNRELPDDDSDSEDTEKRPGKPSIVINQSKKKNNGFKSGPAGGKGGGGGLGKSSNKSGELKVSPETFRLKLNPGDRRIKYFRIENTGNRKTAIKISENLKNVNIDQKTVSLEPGASESIPIYIASGNSSKSLQSGKIIIRGKETVKIPVQLQIQNPSGLLDVQLKLSENKLIKRENGFITAEIFNMGRKKRVDVKITTKILNNQGEIVRRRHETLAVETSASRNFNLNKNLQPGVYTVKLNASYGNRSATAATQFKVTKSTEKSKKLFYALITFITLVSYIVGLKVRREHRIKKLMENSKRDAITELQEKSQKTEKL